VATRSAQTCTRDPRGAAAIYFDSAKRSGGLAKGKKMFTQLDYTMIMVSDMQRSVEFYRDTLGIPLKFQSPGWSEFQTGTTTLALHGGAVKEEQCGDRSKVAGTCSIGFNVKDIDKTYAELTARGAHFVMPPTHQQAEGIKLAVCVDPDGFPISFAQAMAK
jgi:lactoylglutathione lyase